MAEHHIDIRVNNESIFAPKLATPCPDCPSEQVARALAIKFGLNEYVAMDHSSHHRKTLDGGTFSRATYFIPYWHALVKASAREIRLIESRVG